MDILLGFSKKNTFPHIFLCLSTPHIHGFCLSVCRGALALDPNHNDSPVAGPAVEEAKSHLIKKNIKARLFVLHKLRSAKSQSLEGGKRDEKSIRLIIKKYILTSFAACLWVPSH